ncbi:Photosystem II protein D1 [Bienertia sinuspersici]
MHGSLVNSSLIRKTTENEFVNEGYRFEEEPYNIVVAHGYFGRLIFQYASFNNLIHLDVQFCNIKFS